VSTSVLGGKVLDASALVALVRGRLSMLTWIDVARTAGIPLYLPSLALSETRALRADAGPDLADLLGHPWVVLGELDTTTARAVEQLLERATDSYPSSAATVEVVDVLAGHVVHTARTRSWPVLTTDPDRLRRLDPAVEIQLL
jgi:predicted nucleic acid-binding protein